MNKTKQKILDTALKLYNENGIANVSVRQISKEVNISHSNLIYHFPTQKEIVLALHESLLKRAKDLNKNIDLDKLSMVEFYNVTKVGFAVVFDYRFFFNDLLLICKTYAELNKALLAVEKIRSAMYREIIELLIQKNLMREQEYEQEFERLIDLIKIFSDHWLVSSNIYDQLAKGKKIEKYAYLLLTIFYPYLTTKGKKQFKQILITTP